MMEELWDIKGFLKDIRRRIILHSYYTRKIKDGKSSQAALVDWIFSILFLVLFFLITIFNSTRSVLASVSITMILLSFYIIVMVAWRGRVRARRIVAINEQLATERISGQLDKYSNRDFITYVRDLLESYYSTKFDEYKDNIDLVGEIDGEIYGVKCIKAPAGTRVTLKNMEYFILDMEGNGIREGIVVTNTSFADEVREETDYLLMGLEQIEDMLKMAKEGYPSREEIEDLIIDRYDMGRKELMGNIGFRGKGKAYKFILLGVVFYLVSPLVSYPLYYKVVAFISVLYGTIIGVYNIASYIMVRGEETP